MTTRRTEDHPQPHQQHPLSNSQQSEDLPSSMREENPPSYQDTLNESLQLIRREREGMKKVFMMHCQAHHPEGWEARISTLLLAWKYRIGRLTKHECAACYLYFRIIMEIDQQILALSEPLGDTGIPQEL